MNAPRRSRWSLARITRTRDCRLYPAIHTACTAPSGLAPAVLASVCYIHDGTASRPVSSPWIAHIHFHAPTHAQTRSQLWQNSRWNYDSAAVGRLRPKQSVVLRMAGKNASSS